MKTKVSYLLLIYICIASTGNTFADIIFVEAYDQRGPAGYATSNQKCIRGSKPRPIENGH